MSHSPKVAEGAAEMVREMVGDEVPLAYAGGNPDGGLGTSVEKILAAIDAGRPAFVDGREGRKAVEIIRAIYRSARLNAPVALPLTDDVPLGPP